MPEIRLRELPKNYRIKLTKKQEKQFWNRLCKKGSIKEYAQKTETSTNQLYNLKNKDLAYPVNLVFREINIQKLDKIQFKGPNKSYYAKTTFPIKVDNELLTRINYSVKTNKEGTPHYISQEKQLIDRFRDLLLQTAEIPIKTYKNQGQYELRYPKFFHELLNQLDDFEEDLCAKIDEIGEIEEQKFVLPENETVDFDDVDGVLYSREKKLALALYREDSQQVADIISEETEKINKLIG